MARASGAPPPIGATTSPVRNLVRIVKQAFVGDPWGEHLAAPLHADLARQLSGGSGSIVAGATDASSRTAFSGVLPGGLDVPQLVLAPNAYASAAAMHNGVSQGQTTATVGQDSYREILSARYARSRR